MRAYGSLIIQYLYMNACSFDMARILRTEQGKEVWRTRWSAVSLSVGVRWYLGTRRDPGHAGGGFLGRRQRGAHTGGRPKDGPLFCGHDSTGKGRTGNDVAACVCR